MKNKDYRNSDCENQWLQNGPRLQENQGEIRLNANMVCYTGF